VGKKEAINIAKKFAEKIKGIISFKEIILFGSYAKGTNHKDSDIDIALVIGNINYDYFDVYKQIIKKGYEIDNRIEPVILRKDKDFSGLLEMIQKESIVVNKAA
jgi:predicted nucleotidyltransferase